MGPSRIGTLVLVPNALATFAGLEGLGLKFWREDYKGINPSTHRRAAILST